MEPVEILGSGMGHGSRGVVAAGNVVVVGAGASGLLSAATGLAERRGIEVA